MSRLVVTSALATALALFGGMFAGVAVGSLLHGLPFHAAEQTKVALASTPALAGTIGGGALWGYLLARIHRIHETKRMSVAGAISFGPAAVAAGLLLSTMERALVEHGRLPGVPIHVVFTILFVPSTFLVAAAGGLAIAHGSRNHPHRLRFTLATGVAAALAFLVINLTTDSIGWRVGAPRAAERATMLTVMFLGASAAALSAGAVLGRLLAKGSAHGLPGAQQLAGAPSASLRSLPSSGHPKGCRPPRPSPSTGRQGRRTRRGEGGDLRPARPAGGYEVCDPILGWPGGSSILGIMLPVPRDLSRRITDVFGSQGTEWLQRLPELISTLEQQWSIKVGPSLPDLSYSLVVPAVTEDGSEAILKLAVPTEHLACEAEALRIFRGDGTVILLKADPELGALLLERAVPGSPLSSLPDDEEAMAIGAQVMQAFWQPVPDGHPFPSVANWATGLSQLRRRFNGGTGPIPAHAVEQAETIFADLVPSASQLVVLHGDLHHDNILAARRLPWMAIDPKGVIGEPEYDAGSLLRSGVPRLLAAPDPKKMLTRRIGILSSELGFSQERLRRWAIAQSILAAWWAVEDHGDVWQDALDCAALLTEL